jgi:polysaccharide biosynthesis/export protein
MAGRRFLHIITLLLVALSFSYTALADDEPYRVGPEDLLEVKFPEQPTLNGQVKVGQDGMINIDIIGSINATGRTVEELQNIILRQISRLTKISQVSVRVMMYNYNHVFVTGQVNAIGKRTFERIPDLWTIINEAGGISQFGDLSRVTIIRGGEDAGQVEVVNVSRAIAEGKVSKLPKIRRMDTIEIPRTTAGLPAQDIVNVDRKSIVYVFGAVMLPQQIQWEEGMDLTDAIAKAGGPSPMADIKKVRVVTKDGYYAQTTQYNLDKYTKLGNISRYMMRKEDAIYIPEKKGSILGTSMTVAVSVIGLVSSTVLIIDRIGQDNNSNPR